MRIPVIVLAVALGCGGREESPAPAPPEAPKPAAPARPLVREEARPDGRFVYTIPHFDSPLGPDLMSLLRSAGLECESATCDPQSREARITTSARIADLSSVVDRMADGAGCGRTTRRSSSCSERRASKRAPSRKIPRSVRGGCHSR